MSQAPIVIVDYGSGNLASVSNMVRKVGGHAVTSRRKDEILAASKLILCGVGAFDHGVSQLHDLDLFSVISQKAESGSPLLGICLGMQLLGRSSEEGRLGGLGLLDIEFQRFTFARNGMFRVPHVGWNHVTTTRLNPLIAEGGTDRFYFSHSYHPVCANDADVVATTHYGYTFPSVCGRGNVYGVQFHPEKSHRFGMTLMKRFVGL